jgi:hypothetical protein
MDDNKGSNSSGLELILGQKLAFVLYRCATWSVTLREECGLGLFVESRLLRRMFERKGDEGDEITGGCRNFCLPYHVLIG